MACLLASVRSPETTYLCAAMTDSKTTTQLESFGCKRMWRIRSRTRWILGWELTLLLLERIASALRMVGSLAHAKEEGW